MTEFDRLERELTAELRMVGAAARPPSDAWERFARRLDQAATGADLRAHSEPTGHRFGDDRPSHETEIIMRSNETVQPHRRWYILGAAAGLVAVAVVGIALAARDTDPPAPAATVAPATVAPTIPAPALAPIELLGADGDADAIEAFEIIEDAYEAFNTGDAMGWATPRGAAADSGPADPADRELEYVRAAHVAGARYDVASCTYEGPSEIELTGGHGFVCITKLVDAFTTAAGIDLDEEFEWIVADGRVVDAVSSYENRTVLRTFMGDLATWLRTEHPDTAFTPIEFYNYPLAAEVPAVLDLVDEFVAADERWPWTGA